MPIMHFNIIFLQFFYLKYLLGLLTNINMKSIISRYLAIFAQNLMKKYNDFLSR